MPEDRPSIPFRTRALLLALACSAGTCGAAEPISATLEALSPLATQQEIVRRLLSPVQREEFERAVERRRARIQAHTVSVGQESFDLFVPDAPEGARYGLIVFVPPVDAFTVPRAWRGVLQRRRLILIAARDSGNGANMLERRVPLALHGYHHAMRHYPVDPERVYLAGFSGGGRTAQIVAFGWPDVFRGVLQFAGSDPFGETAVPPPPEPMLELARRRLRIVHSSGTADAPYMAIDARTRRSLAALCVGNVSQVDQPRLGHALPGARGFARAVDALLQPGAASAREDACSRRLRARIETRLQAVERLVEAGDTAQARGRLRELDNEFGWLAAPRSRALARRVLDATASAARTGTEATP